MKIHSDQLPTRVFILPTSNLDTTCIFELYPGTFLNFQNFEFWPHFGPKNLFLRPKLMKVHSDKLPTTVFIQLTSNLDRTWISKLSWGTFFEFSKFRKLTSLLVKNRFYKDLFDEKMTYINRIRLIFISSSYGSLPIFNKTYIAKYNEYIFRKISKF